MSFLMIWGNLSFNLITPFSFKLVGEIEMFYLNSTLNITAQQKGKTARWYSNKTSPVKMCDKTPTWRKIPFLERHWLCVWTFESCGFTKDRQSWHDESKKWMRQAILNEDISIRNYFLNMKNNMHTSLQVIHLKL